MHHWHHALHNCVSPILVLADSRKSGCEFELERSIADSNTFAVNRLSKNGVSHFADLLALVIIFMVFTVYRASASPYGT